MSYCRWSTDAFRCDVYAYEDVSGGWTIHVAGRKRQIPDSVVCPFSMPDYASPEWFKYYQEFQTALDSYPFVALTAPSAGETFNEPTLAEFRDRMTVLRAEGLRFPNYVFDVIDQEIAEEDAA
jgi:hypothetical protein